MNKIAKRIRNRKVILAVASGIIMILVNLGIIGEDMSNQVMEIINMVLTIGVTVGIFANPESHIKEEVSE